MIQEKKKNLKFPQYQLKDFSSIYILCSLRGTQEIMTKSIDNTIEYPYQLLCLNSASEWDDAWKQIENDCINGQKPFIHILMHGKPDGLRIGDKGEVIEWSKFLEQLDKVNKLCDNQLCVNLQVCYGAYCISHAITMEDMPFSVMLSSPDEIDLCKSLLGVKNFYEGFEKGGLETAIEDFIYMYENSGVNQNLHSKWNVFFRSNPLSNCINGIQIRPIIE